jgi:electron transport complex protein RnfB
VAGPAEARSPAIAVRSGGLEDAIDALLPQTQCTKCGFEGCRPYAVAIANGSVSINRCPPGGAAGIARLARLLGRAELPLDPACGVEAPRRVAWIDPGLCIGCTKCIQACPVDAIIGGQRRMHTVAAALCTGCDLCMAPCPVDCIVMRPLSGTGEAPPWSDADADSARARHLLRRARLARMQERRQARLAARAPAAAVTRDAAAGSAAPAASGEQSEQRRQAVIEAAMRRARERLAAAHTARPVPPR